MEFGINNIKMQEIKSPITKSNNVSFLRTINVKEIIKKYKLLGINVTKYFNQRKEILVYKCNDTGYKFYYPFNIDGDSSFYEYFQSFKWYYMPWKWEHEISKNYLKEGMKVLEVGCAHGAFLKKINELFDLKLTVGLELNKSAKINHEKLIIKNETVQEFSKKKIELFDFVCSYQVLEHISDVRSFLKAKIDCLKKGGTLVISVPNNESFIKDMGVGLNSPPHHMGLWDEKSLKALEFIFPIELVKIHKEELQEHHVGSYVYSKYYAGYPNLFARLILRFNKLFSFYDKQTRDVNSNRKKIIGHTILAVYNKK